MRTLWAASAGHLRRHPGQSALAVLGLALGVATVTAIGLATASARRALELSLDAVNGEATHQITAGPRGVAESVYVELSTRRTAELAPVVEGYAVVAGQTVLVLGVDPLADPGLRTVQAPDRDPTLLRRWLTEPGTVMASVGTARALGLEVGKPFALEVAGRTFEATFIGQIRADRPGFDNLVLTDIAQAQEWLGMIGRLSRIDVRAAASAAGPTQLARLRAQLPPGLSIAETARHSRETTELTSAFMTNLRAMSLLALLVGAFLIYNSMGFSLLRRRPVIGVLRALGVTRAQVLGVVLAEAGVLGVIGAGAGALAGLWLARQLLTHVTRTINDLYFVVSVSEIDLAPGTLIAAAGFGIATALLAALVPALEAARTLPQLALRRSVLEQRAARSARALAATSAVLIAAAGLLVWASERSLLAGFMALLLLLLSAAFLTPATLRAIATVSARVAGRSGVAARLGLADVAASLSRTGVAVAALSIAVAAAIGVAVMVASFRQSLADWLERTLRADIYVTAPGPGFSRPERVIAPQVARTLVASASVREHSASRRVAVESPLGRVSLDALQPAARSYAGFTLIEGAPEETWRAFGRGEVLLSEPFAYRHGLRAGERIELVTATGPRAFRVAGVYRDYSNDRGAVLMSREIYRRAWADDAITSMGLYLRSGADPGTVIESLRAATRDRQALLMRSNSDLRALSMQIFERTFAITRVLYWLAVAVAAVGLLSALLAYELERARELALLRALGVTPAGVALLVETQTTFLGLAAGAAAVPTGFMAAFVLIEVINARAFGWHIDFHWGASAVANTVAIAAAAALLAGLYPAWRSARAPIAPSMREE